jgi:cellulose synthase/poly-beta-1,6-N-acetylglucosamine synthase-like glycosyltransferase
VIQAILRISNVHDSWITRIFACEYAGWFRVLLNGRSRLKFYTPLGGTGNYIRADAMRSMAMWTPLNLAEDAELALRLHLNGYRTVVINGRHKRVYGPTHEQLYIKTNSGYLLALTFT